ncbi:MAG: hypothetical protein L0Y71_08995 [Gemmataceae bacterium]|nr:hypothetical protein [Gemmataceae bacterium]
MAVAQKQAKCLQLTIWLGNTQTFHVVADERYVNRDPCRDEMNYSKKDAVEKPAMQKLIDQLLRDLDSALKGGAPSISIAVEGNEIVPRQV